MRLALLQLEVGDKVSYVLNGKVATAGMLVFVRGNGYQMHHGGAMVGVNKVLFQINKVKLPNTKPPIQSENVFRDDTLQ